MVEPVLNSRLKNGLLLLSWCHSLLLTTAGLMVPPETNDKTMSSRTTRGGREGREVFLSAHRCPEVDVLPQHHCESQLPPPSSGVSAEKTSEFTPCVGAKEADYLDISSSCCTEEEEEEGEDGGSISDWSEEDLSLHFSPSVILQSDEESDPESGFECVDVAMETKVSVHCKI